jgi:ABC-type uncharacterized transport system substrate-binding protein
VINRRTFLAGTGAVLLAAPLAAEAQPAAKIARIGYLAVNFAANPHLLDVFRQGLRDLGYVEGLNLIIEIRDAHGNAERLPALAAELIELKVDVILAPTPVTTRATMRATRAIPIIFIGAGDPVGGGLVASLARPGGNVTGTATFGPELLTKRLELLKEVLPGVSRVAALWIAAEIPERTRAEYVKAAKLASRELGVRVQFFVTRGRADFERAFSEMTRERARAVLMLISEPHRDLLVDLAAKKRLPAVYGSKTFVDAGGFMSYGPNLDGQFRHATIYVDKILRGAKPADLPVEQTTKFELVINLKTAKALGLTIPPSLLARADELIQ